MKTTKKSVWLMAFFAIVLWVVSAQTQAASQYSGVININTATVEQIVQLPGIGPKKAQAIIELRNKKPFTKIEELLLVDGIGEALFAKIKPFLALEGQTTLKETPAAAAPSH